MVQVGWMWMPTFQRNGTCGPFNRRRPTHPTTRTSAGLFSINFKRIRIALFNIALYKISRSNLVICEMFLSLKQHLLVFQIDLRSHNSSWGLISGCGTSFDFLLSPFLFFFLYYFINTSRNGEGLKLSSIFICPGLFFYKSSFRKRKCDLYYRRKLILLFTWHSPKYGIPVNDTCHWCPKKACDVSRLDAWTWGRQGKKSSNTDRPMFLSWIPFYPLLLFVKDSAWAVSKFSRVLLYWRDTLHNSICKNTD